MIRRRRSSDVVVLDLGIPVRPGGADADADGGARLADATAPRLAPPHRTPAQARRQAVAAGTVLVLALTGWGVASSVRTGRHDDRIAAAPGGVLSLERPPEEAWSASTDGAGEWLVLPGIVVVREGAQLVGLDAATGTEHWRAQVGGDPVCAPGGGSGGPDLPAAERITCWSGPNAGRSFLTVVDRDGLVATRDAPADADYLTPGPDGTLLTLRRVGPELPAPDVEVSVDDPSGLSIGGSVLSGRDAVLRAEDAATGDVHWERTIPFRPVTDLATCVSWSSDASGRLVADVSSVGIWVSGSFVEVTGCGLRSRFTLDGAPLGDAALNPWSYVQAYPDGGWLEQVVGSPDSGMRSILHGLDGSTETFDQEVLLPGATDGAPSDVRLAGRYPASMRAIAPDGTELWRTTLQVTDVLVRAGGEAVVALADRTIVAVDLGTGETRWEADDVFPTGGTQDRSIGGVIWSVFTDGAHALLVPRTDATSDVPMVAVDLATGDVLWRDSLPSRTQLVAVGGRLLEAELDDAGQVEIRDEGGQYVRHSDGTVRAFR